MRTVQYFPLFRYFLIRSPLKIKMIWLMIWLKWSETSKQYYFKHVFVTDCQVAVPCIQTISNVRTVLKYDMNKFPNLLIVSCRFIKKKQKQNIRWLTDKNMISLCKSLTLYFIKYSKYVHHKYDWIDILRFKDTHNILKMVLPWLYIYLHIIISFKIWQRKHKTINQ